MGSRHAVCLLFAVALVSCAPARTDLFSYVARPEPEWRWEKKSEMTVGELKVCDLYLCSQVWRDIKWEHTVRIVSPPTVQYPETMLLLITGGNPGPQELGLGGALVQAFGGRVAVLYNIPNQPLFGGLTEDDLIAHTFVEYAKSGDEEWPLLFPMAKSAVKAMDALQAFTEREFGQKVESFVVTGGSKRGWTTWLAGIADPRVKGIAPVVFDNLNLNAQMPYQLATWDRYSEMIEEYTRRGLQAQLGTERGQKLVKMVDPYSYLSRLTMPKLIVNATNDRYWTVDALNLYWNDLPGDKWILYVPNSGHGINDMLRVVKAESAFFQHVAGGLARSSLGEGGPTMPRMKWAFSQSKGKLTLRLESEPKPKTAKLWVAKTGTRDFRDSKWEEKAMQTQGSAFVGTVEVPKQGHMAAFGEAEFEIGGKAFALSTAMRVVPEIPKSLNKTRPRAHGRR